eukprot:m51a1_g3 hypothetical protein (195) ;mRNA; f:8153-8966
MECPCAAQDVIRACALIRAFVVDRITSPRDLVALAGAHPRVLAAQCLSRASALGLQLPAGALSDLISRPVEGCSKIYTFVGTGPRQGTRYCTHHRRELDPTGQFVSVFKCHVDTCNERAVYGAPGGRALYCKAHKLEGHVVAYARVCIVDGCKKSATYGAVGGTRQYCAGHRKPEHVMIYHTKKPSEAFSGKSI